MNYYKDKKTTIVYAYDDEQLAQVARLNEIERLMSQSSFHEAIKDEYDAILPVFFEIRDNINSMHEMTQKEIDAYLNPPVSKEQLIAGAEQQKQSLLKEATNAIALLQDAMDLDMATDKEELLLKEWKKYRVLLNRVDTSTAPDIEWTEKPNK